MQNITTFRMIPLTQIVYNQKTQLFPYSPRNEIDHNLVKSIKQSIAETGMWAPVVVKNDTMEGIAGNHRLLAYINDQLENRIPINQILIPAMLIDCDESTAVLIGLTENEIRQPLTEWEWARSLQRTYQRKPAQVERIFNQNEWTVRQLSLWQTKPEYQNMPSRQAPMGRLNQQWLSCVKERLGSYPRLYRQFMTCLQDFDWVNSHTLSSMQKEITRSLIDCGIKFVPEITWNSEPAPKCLGTHEQDIKIIEQIHQGKITINLDGTITGTCPYLYIQTTLIPQFIPDEDGNALLSVTNISPIPHEVVKNEDSVIHGQYSYLMDTYQAFCIAPDCHEPGGCFKTLENLTREKLLCELLTQGRQVTINEDILKRKSQGDFIWKRPVYENNPCQPSTCIHAGDIPSGYIELLYPDGKTDMVCLNRECGTTAQDALEENEKSKRREEKKRIQELTQQLRLKTYEIVFSRFPSLELDNSVILEMLEKILLPDWDRESMYHLIVGWQVYTQKSIAEELNIVVNDVQVISTFLERFDILAESANDENIIELIQKLRSLICSRENGFRLWMILLILIRNWRDKASSVENLHKLLSQYDEIKL